MFEILARNALRIREHRFAGERKATLLYASDLHLHGRAGNIVDQVMAAVDEVKPDLVLLGGDLADTAGGLAHLSRLVRASPAVAAVPGNHDEFTGREVVRGTVREAGGHWLCDGPLEVGSLRIAAEGDMGDVLCAHNPAVFPRAVECGFRLVLAGHLHGSQCVWAERNGRLYPGAWFFRWNGDLFEDRGTTMIVSRGVNDTLPVRWRCPRDVVVCRFGGEGDSQPAGT